MEDKSVPINQCFHCNCLIKGKPWITVKRKDQIYNGCDYLCSIKLSDYIGNGYWKDVVNKEDFNEPRPVFEIHKSHIKSDITASSYDIDEIRNEIELENQRMEQFEKDYVYSSSEEDNSSVENYPY